MREILFKAKRIDNGEWVEGSYVYTFNEDKKCPVIFVMTENYWIAEKDGNIVLIDKDTLCQYTGLTDKNGRKIWENDVIKLPELLFGGNCVGTVEYIHGSFRVYSKKYCRYLQMSGVVIGNIFDNPELLEGGAE